MRSLGVAINQERKTRVYRVSIAQTELSRRFLAEGPPNMGHTYIVRHAGKEPIRTIMEKGPVSQLSMLRWTHSDKELFCDEERSVWLL